MALQPIQVAPNVKQEDSGGGALGGIIGAVLGAAATIATAGAAAPVTLPLIAGGISGGMGIGSLVGGIADKAEAGGQEAISKPQLGATADEMGPISRRFQGAGGGQNDILQSSISAAQATPQIAQNPAIMNPLLEAQQKAKSRIGRA
jgi:hypothetical protein